MILIAGISLRADWIPRAVVASLVGLRSASQYDYPKTGR
jgi:hypothetical protein